MKKKYILMGICVMIVLVFFFAPPKVYGFDELIEKTRDELSISDVDTVELKYAGAVGKEDSILFWFIAGNEHQARYYLPMEFRYLDRNMFLFVKSYKPIERSRDVAVLQWQRGYCFVNNNSDCAALQIEETILEMPDGVLPYIEYMEFIPSSYAFLDKSGQEIPVL